MFFDEYRMNATQLASQPAWLYQPTILREATLLRVRSTEAIYICHCHLLILNSLEAGSFYHSMKGRRLS